MITRDWFMRMIHLLAQAIAKVLGLADARQFGEALGEVERSSKKLLGMDLRLLTSLSDEELIRLLSLGDRFDVEKCVVAAELLRVLGEVKDRQGDEVERHHCYTTALSLFIELQLREEGMLPKEYFDKMDLLIGKLSGYKLPLALREKIFKFYETAGRYDAAENVLFNLVEEDNTFVEEGLKFYDRLRKKNEEELVRGNLTREEVESSIRDLTKQTRRR